MLLFTVDAQVPKSGRLLLPPEAPDRVALHFVLLGARVALITRTSVAGARRCINLPTPIQRAMKLPGRFIGAAHTTIEQVEPREQRIMPLDDVLVASGSLHAHKDSINLILSMYWTRGLMAVGWTAVNCVLEHVAGVNAPIRFTGPLHTNAQGVGSIRIPAHSLKDFRDGDQVIIRLRSAVFTRPHATTWWADDWFDLALVVPPQVSVEADGDFLQLSSNYARPFQVKRRVSARVWAYLCGVYQAEGSKEGLEFCIPQKLPGLLRTCLQLLVDHVGLPKDRFYLHAKLFSQTMLDEPMIRAHYTHEIGLPVRTVRDYRATRGYGTEVAELHFEESITLQRMLNASLERLIDVELSTLSPAVATAFALGFLDGDGSIIINDSAYVSFSGDDREVRAACQALEHGLGWARREAQTAKHDGVNLKRRLDLSEIVDLIAAGAFKFTLSRPKLIHEAYARAERLEDDRPFHRDWAQVWAERDALIAEGAPTLASVILFQKCVANPLLGSTHEALIDNLRARWLTSPLIRQSIGAETHKAHQRMIREREAVKHPEPQLETLDGCRIIEISTDQAKPIILRYEWLGDVGKPLACYGLVSARRRLDVDNVDGRELLGVVIFGVAPGARSSLLCGPAWRARATCLSRGACVHWAPQNAATFLIRGAIRLAAAKHNWCIFFAYADEHAGELGTIYQTLSWAYLGRGESIHAQYVDPTGNVVSSRAMRRRGLTVAKAALAGWRQLQAPPKHKFVWFEGDRRLKKQLRKALTVEVNYNPPKRYKSAAKPNSLPVHVEQSRCGPRTRPRP